MQDLFDFWQSMVVPFSCSQFTVETRNIYYEIVSSNGNRIAYY